MEGETETQSFSIVPAGQAMTRQGAITESLVLCEDLGLSQTVIDEVASGIYRNRFGVTFATTGHTLSYSEPQNSSELWEPLTFIAPTTAAVGDVVWSVPRNRSSTDF